MTGSYKQFTQWLIHAGLMEQFVYDSLEGNDLTSYCDRYEMAVREALQ